MVLIFGAAITLGYFVELPVWGFGGDTKEKTSQDEEAVREALAVENQLTVLNTMIDGNPDSEKLKELLAQLKENKYGDQVEPVNYDPEVLKVLAGEHEVDLEEFAGQLDFYSGGEKLGTLKGETDPIVVEQTIDRYLAGLIKRYGPGWIPKVEGMTQAQPTAPTLAAPRAVQSKAKPKTVPSGVPGMERVESGVPGMTRTKPAKKKLKVEPEPKQ